MGNKHSGNTNRKTFEKPVHQNLGVKLGCIRNLYPKETIVKLLAQLRVIKSLNIKMF